MIITRKAFLSGIAVAAISVFAVILAGAIGAFLSPVRLAGYRRTGLLRKPDEYPCGIPLREGDYFIVRTEAGISAISAKCTHLGCPVQWNNPSKEFRCPCHGSAFDLNGNPTRGPASTALRKIPVELIGATAYFTD